MNKVEINGEVINFKADEFVLVIGKNIRVGNVQLSDNLALNPADKNTVTLYGTDPLSVFGVHTINVTGSVGQTVETTGDVTVGGNCGKISTTGSVAVSGNSGEVNTTGDVQVGKDVQGKVSTMGDVTVHGNVGGKIDTMGDVNVGSNKK